MKLPKVRPAVRLVLLSPLGLGLGVFLGLAANPTNPPVKASTNAAPAKSRFIVDDVGGTAAPAKEDTEGQSAELSKQADDWMSRGKYAEAVAVLEKAIKLAPENEELRFNLAFSYNRIGRAREAIAQYRETIRILPEYAEAHNNLGNLLVRNGDVGGAVEQFQAAIKYQPENSSAHNNLGTALVRIGKPTEALAQFEEAIRLRADYAEAWQNLGLSRLTQHQVPAAVDALDTALRLNPRLEVSRKALAQIRERTRAAAAGATSGVSAPAPSSAPR